ncbi:hypothetical protein JCM19232_3330 [Vibrio ishigakensis]|uniref:Uncharacterized protein n=1 Tax=Vibrio ishigakensis TaxID=1481914 RepID=A0A0B8PMY8_9VIBR|nr:hypothetical protein JCM19232_3330 [Vibrio ishigakensis]
MDGMHRVCKALINGDSHIKAVHFPNVIEPHFTDVDPDTLPY